MAEFKFLESFAGDSSWKYDDLISVENEQASPTFNLYPNPAIDQVQIDFKNPLTGMLEIYTVQGHLIKQVNLHETTTLLLDVQDLASGMYIVRHEVSSFRLLK